MSSSQAFRQGRADIFVNQAQCPILPSGPQTPIAPPRYFTQAIGEDGGLPWDHF